jgi:hypothetical protein
VVGVIFSGMFGLPNNAYATCVNTIQAQAIAAAYEGDEEPTVHTMDTCSGDDVSYQIPIATTITFDGVEYSNIYATTNSVITFGQPDGTFWQYPNTPSISLYSMDWFPGRSNTTGLDIYYSEGGFQINLNMVPYGNYSAQPSTVNILVAITNTGGISVAYSYQGPEYANMRTGVRLHNGDIVSLEAWGATQIEAGEALPTLEPEPVIDPSASPEPTPTPTPSPTPTPLTPEQEQQIISESYQLASEISDLNNLIALINGDSIEEQETTPEPSPEPTQNPNDNELDPDVTVDPEIITPDDPRFPDDEEQNEPEDPNPSPSSDTGNEEDSNEDPDVKPTPEPSPQPTDTDQDQETEPDQSDNEEPVSPSPDNNSTDDGSNAISEEELRKLNNLISANDAKLLAQLVGTNETIKQAVEEFTARAEENADAPMPYTIADAITEVQAEQLLEDPVGAITSIFTEIDMETLTSPTEWGKDMTDDQREKVQEIVVSVIIASNLVSASMTRRK